MAGARKQRRQGMAESPVIVNEQDAAAGGLV
jgi:hypothetical protein